MTMFQLLAGWALRSAIFILSGVLLLRLLRVKDPAIRLAACTAMLFGSLAMPLFTEVAPRMPVPIMREAVLPPGAQSVFYEPAPLPEVSRQPVRTSRRFDWARAAMVSYVLIASALLLRLCAGLLKCLRLLRRSRATGQSTVRIEIRESDLVASPVALGIARPTIVLPADWRQWDAPKLDAVLAHERSHIQRHDAAVQFLSAIHRALLWHSPLSWFLHRNLVRIAEEASDDAAVAATRDRARYAEVLLDFMQRGVRRANWQGVPMARYGRPDERIHRILDATALSRGLTRRSMAAILILGAPLAYVVAAVQETVPHKPLTFEVVSVKPATVPDGVQVNGDRMLARKGAGIAIPRNTGGPGSSDPGRIHFQLISLKALLNRAYDSYFEIVGPGWLDTQTVQIEATMPPETTKEQFQEMLRNLMADRFELKSHRETKEVKGYSLVAARNGPKLKESPNQNEAPSGPPTERPKKGPNGFLILPPRPGPWIMSMGLEGNRARMVGQQQTMQDLARWLGRQLNSSVTDATGLTTKYDFTLTYAGGIEPGSALADGTDQLPDILTALQSDLGLKLEPKKVPVEVLVIDRMEKTPTGN